MMGPSKGAPATTPLGNHEHEWILDESGPILEDGAAIFFEYCNWVEITSSVTSEKHDETFYGTGAECDAFRSYRMEEVSVTKKRDDAPDITYLASELDHFWLLAERAEIDIMDDGEITSCDPEKVGGEVIAETDDWKIRYEP